MLQLLLAAPRAVVKPLPEAAVSPRPLECSKHSEHAEQWLCWHLLHTQLAQCNPVVEVGV